jgi:hypothetical protein
MRRLTCGAPPVLPVVVRVTGIDSQRPLHVGGTDRYDIGTALVQHVFDVARARRFTGVRVWTGTDNPRAQRFYSRLGMAPTGRRALGTRSEQMQYELVVFDR